MTRNDIFFMQKIGLSDDAIRFLIEEDRAQREYRRTHRKLRERFYYADMEGMELFLGTLGYHCRVGKKFWHNVHELGKREPLITVKECGTGYEVELTTVVKVA